MFIKGLVFMSRITRFLGLVVNDMMMMIYWDGLMTVLTVSCIFNVGIINLLNNNSFTTFFPKYQSGHKSTYWNPQEIFWCDSDILDR